METRLAKRRRRTAVAFDIVVWARIFGFLNIVDPKDRVLRLLVPLRWHKTLMTSWYKASRVEVTSHKYERTITVNGELHNEDESTPAVVGSTNHKMWYWCGYEHRSGGLPSYISHDGQHLRYSVHGELHREGGMPAVEDLITASESYVLRGKYIAEVYKLAYGGWDVHFRIPKYRTMRFATHGEAVNAARRAMKRAQLALE